MGTLDDPWGRLKRANHYIEILDHDFGVSDILPPYRVRPEMHRRGLEYRLHVIESAPEVDEAVPFVVSELLFNLRSALDQLSYQLHVRHYRGRVPG